MYYNRVINLWDTYLNPFRAFIVILNGDFVCFFYNCWNKCKDTNISRWIWGYSSLRQWLGTFYIVYHNTFDDALSILNIRKFENWFDYCLKTTTIKSLFGMYNLVFWKDRRLNQWKYSRHKNSKVRCRDPTHFHWPITYPYVKHYSTLAHTSSCGGKPFQLVITNELTDSEHLDNILSQ